MELKITKNRVLSAAESSGFYRNVLSKLFPEVFSKTFEVGSILKLTEGRYIVVQLKLNDGTRIFGVVSEKYGYYHSGIPVTKTLGEMHKILAGFDYKVVEKE